jgi:acetylornithine deacetylase/succinyl-diaminopimelate desuccinylase-like protein
MTSEQKAALREAASKAQASLATPGYSQAYDDLAALAHPAAVLTLLDETERMRAGGEHARGALRALIPLIETLPGGDELAATINEAIVLSEFGA